MNKLVNISDALTIAVHSLAIIAKAPGYTNGVEISEISGYSRNHTAKVLQTLTKHKLLLSERGPKGGFRMSQDPAMITFMDVYRIIEGDYEVGSACKHNKGHCLFKECVFGGISVKLAAEFEEYLLTKTIGDLI